MFIFPSHSNLSIYFKSLKLRSINKWRYRYCTDIFTMSLVQIWAIESHLRHCELRNQICQIDKIICNLIANYDSLSLRNYLKNKKKIISISNYTKIFKIFVLKKNLITKYTSDSRNSRLMKFHRDICSHCEHWQFCAYSNGSLQSSSISNWPPRNSNFHFYSNLIPLQIDNVESDTTVWK